MLTLSTIERTISKTENESFLSCTINASNWANFRFTQTPKNLEPSVFVLYDEETDLLEIYAVNELDPLVKKIIFQLSNVSEAGEYQFTYNDKALVLIGENWFDTCGSENAKIIITKFNHELKVIEGFFSFDAGYASNTQLSVNDGAFHLRY